jgi:hypothetical protein
MTTVVKCCFCKVTIEGDVRHCVPPGYPRDPRNDGRSLCAVCGGGPTPTLDEICWTLDEELANRRYRTLLLGTVVVVVAGALGGLLFGPWGLLACPGLGLLGAIVLRASERRTW